MKLRAWNLANRRPIHVKRRPPPFAMLFRPQAGPGTWQIADQFMANGDRPLLTCFFGLWTGPEPGKSSTDSWETATAPFCHAFSASRRAWDLANRRPFHVKRRPPPFDMLFRPLDGPGTWQIADLFMSNGDRPLLTCFFGLWTGPEPGKSQAGLFARLSQGPARPRTQKKDCWSICSSSLF